MRELPILFAPAMVSAILAGKKTQTRRPIPAKGGGGPDPSAMAKLGNVGDRLWARETWQAETNVLNPKDTNVWYAADEFLPPEQWPLGLWNIDKWRPSIHMPREASRLTLEITATRVERLQDITPADVYSWG